MLELRREHVLDVVHQRGFELETAVGREVTACHQPEHFDGRDRHQWRSHRRIPIAKKAARGGAERRRSRGQLLLTRSAHGKLRSVPKQVERLHQEISGRPTWIRFARELIEGPHRELVHAVHRVPVLANALGQLGDHRGMRHALDLARDSRAWQPLRLREHVQLAAPFGEEHVDMAVQLKRRPELAFRPAHALGDRPDLPMGAGQEREDPVRLSVIELPKDDRVLAVGAQWELSEEPSASTRLGRAGGVKPNSVNTSSGHGWSLVSLTCSTRLPRACSTFHRARPP